MAKAKKAKTTKKKNPTTAKHIAAISAVVRRQAREIRQLQEDMHLVVEDYAGEIAQLKREQAYVNESGYRLGTEVIELRNKLSECRQLWSDTRERVDQALHETSDIRMSRTATSKSD